MPTSRRELLAGLTLGAAAPSIARTTGRVSAIAFDAFVLFSPAEIVRRAVEMVGTSADAFVASATARLFSYTWLYTSAARYIGFEELARDAFGFTASASGLNIGGSQLDRLVEGYSSLEAWPDVAVVLHSLRQRGVRLAVLSNLPRHSLESSLRSARLRDHFEKVLSTDEARRFKPAPEAYALASSRLGLPKRWIGFAASAAWDAAGATWFGYPTVWVNRSHAPSEEPQSRSLIVTSDMEGVLELTR